MQPKDEYLEALAAKFGKLKIEVVNFDNGATPESMAAYILVSGLTKPMLKDKGSTVLDLGNYLYRRFGIQYEPVPEFHRSGEAKDSVAFYISKGRLERIPHLQDWIIDSYNARVSRSDYLGHGEVTNRVESALYFGSRFVVPNSPNPGGSK